MGVNTQRQFFLVYHHNTFLSKMVAMLCDGLFLLTHGGNSKRLVHIFEFRELETWRCFSRYSNQQWSTTNHWLLEYWIIIPHFGSFTSNLQSEVTAKSDPMNLIPLQLFTGTLLPFRCYELCPQHGWVNTRWNVALKKSDGLYDRFPLVMRDTWEQEIPI